MSKPLEILWDEEPSEHVLEAAKNYLELHYDHWKAAKYVHYLKDGEERRFKAKDLLRASRLALLPRDNPYVQRHLDKIDRGEPLSPVLLVRAQPLLIVDGYHRTCAAYWIDENTVVSARIA